MCGCGGGVRYRPPQTQTPPSAATQNKTAKEGSAVNEPAVQARYQLPTAPLPNKEKGDVNLADVLGG